MLVRLLISCYLLLVITATASAQAPATKPPVCLPAPVAQQLLDSLRHLPTVRREAQEWQRAYVNQRVAADTNAYAAKEFHQALLHSQVAFSGQQLLLNEQRQEKEKFKQRAHRKGWVIAALLAGIGAFIYLH